MSKTVGNYQLTLKLGSGSYATVYEAHRTSNNEVFAIKRIEKKKLGNDAKMYGHLENEIKIMRDYVHTNVVRFYEILTSEKNFYLVLEFCPGGDLAKFIRSSPDRHLSDAVSRGFFVQLVSGLSFLHSCNVIHRDIKPQNLLLSESSFNAKIKIADFGFAKHLPEACMAETSCGSPRYMAPEILRGNKYDSSADVWSLGCVYYEMLTGDPPFPGETVKELVNNIRTRALVIPPDLMLSWSTQQLLKTLLVAEPKSRGSLGDTAELISDESGNLCTLRPPLVAQPRSIANGSPRAVSCTNPAVRTGSASPGLPPRGPSRESSPEVNTSGGSSGGGGGGGGFYVVGPEGNRIKIPAVKMLHLAVSAELQAIEYRGAKVLQTPVVEARFEDMGDALQDRAKVLAWGQEQMKAWGFSHVTAGQFGPYVSNAQQVLAHCASVLYPVLTRAATNLQQHVEQYENDARDFILALLEQAQQQPPQQEQEEGQAPGTLRVLNTVASFEAPLREFFMTLPERITSILAAANGNIFSSSHGVDEEGNSTTSQRVDSPVDFPSEEAEVPSVPPVISGASTAAAAAGVTPAGVDPPASFNGAGNGECTSPQEVRAQEDGHSPSAFVAPAAGMDVRPPPLAAPAPVTPVPARTVPPKPRICPARLVPQAQLASYTAALQVALGATVEEWLGNFTRAVTMYDTAHKLLQFLSDDLSNVQTGATSKISLLPQLSPGVAVVTAAAPAAAPAAIAEGEEDKTLGKDVDWEPVGTTCIVRCFMSLVAAQKASCLLRLSRPSAAQPGAV